MSECLEIVLDGGEPMVAISSARNRLIATDNRRFQPATPIWDAVLKVEEDPDTHLLCDSGRDIVFRRRRSPDAGRLLKKLVGSYCNDDLAVRYSVVGDGVLRMQGRLGFQDDRLTPVFDDLPTAGPFGPFASFHRPRFTLERDADGVIGGLSVFTHRTKGLAFRWVEEPAHVTRLRAANIGTAAGLGHNTGHR